MIVEVVCMVFECILFEFFVDIMDKGIVFFGGGVLLCSFD